MNLFDLAFPAPPGALRGPGFVPTQRARLAWGPGRTLGRVHAFPRPAGVSRGGIAEGRSLVLGRLLGARSLRRIPGSVPTRALAVHGVPQTETRAQGLARHSPVNTGHTRPRGHTPRGARTNTRTRLARLGSLSSRSARARPGSLTSSGGLRTCP